MVTIATAPVLLSRPTAACASARSIVLAMLAKSFWVLFVWRVCVFMCVRIVVAAVGGGIGRCHYLPSSVSHLIRVSVVYGSVNTAVITLISCAQVLFVQQFKELTK